MGIKSKSGIRDEIEISGTQEETRCSICGAEINNDSWICTACDEDVYFPVDKED